MPVCTVPRSSKRVCQVIPHVVPTHSVFSVETYMQVMFQWLTLTEIIASVLALNKLCNNYLKSTNSNALWKQSFRYQFGRLFTLSSSFLTIFDSNEIPRPKMARNLFLDIRYCSRVVMNTIEPNFFSVNPFPAEFVLFSNIFKFQSKSFLIHWMSEFLWQWHTPNISLMEPSDDEWIMNVSVYDALNVPSSGVVKILFQSYHQTTMLLNFNYWISRLLRWPPSEFSKIVSWIVQHSFSFDGTYGLGSLLKSLFRVLSTQSTQSTQLILNNFRTLIQCVSEHDHLNVYIPVHQMSLRLIVPLLLRNLLRNFEGIIEGIQTNDTIFYKRVWVMFLDEIQTSKRRSILRMVRQDCLHSFDTFFAMSLSEDMLTDEEQIQSLWDFVQYSQL